MTKKKKKEATAGPEFSFEGYIPVEMNVKTVEEARADLAAHEKKFPGDYFKCHAEGRLDERREWLIQREKLETGLDLALAYQGAKRATRSSVPQKKRPEGPRSLTAPDRKTPEDFADILRSKLRIMEALTPGSPDWQIARLSACSARSNAIRRAKEDRTPCPALPLVPRFCDLTGKAVAPDIPTDRKLTPQEAGRLGGRARLEIVSKSALYKRQERERKALKAEKGGE